jgi:hypothetical protein
MGNQTYFSIPGVASVTWVEAKGLMLVWWEGWANSTEFTALLDAEVRGLREHGGSRLLADCRLQRVLSSDDQQRANRDWVPRAVEAGLKRFAVVLPLSDMAAGHIQERLSEVSGPAFEVAYFTTVDDAEAWLRD